MGKSKWKRVLLYAWQLPQNLVGLLLIWFYRPQRRHVLDNGVEIHYSDRMSGGISLGKYCLVNTSHYRTELSASLSRNTVRHEAVGHTAQSRMLGWLYLIVIGLPSLIWAALYGPVIPYTRNGYYRFYTEKWADRLAGIERR